ncbi:glycosyltransferase family 2 protein [Jeotgalibacillus proteolyticus]|uniref:glycosyltransferase family 2 protein n=1 Tax=Jeotgalibacillus proteolyticus TaxID=2082395 RepID=UPI003CEA80BC
MDIKVSVIVPVYNAEKFLEVCIKSLVNQTLKECEFIFVNDGSTDGSEMIITRYTKSDKRIKLINQKNSGVSAARNAGIEKAMGKYIGFVDADDYVQKDMFELFYNHGEKYKADVIFSDFISELEGCRLKTDYPFTKGKVLDKSYIEKIVIPYIIEEDNFNSVCNKIYRNSIIKKNELAFPTDISLGEDGYFNLQFMHFIGTMFYLEYAGYFYREVSGSATRNILVQNYFERALKVYKGQLPVNLKLNEKKLNELKSTKLIRNVFSYIHIYFKPTKQLSLYNRYLFVKSMINHYDVQHSLAVYIRHNYHQSNRYEKFILLLIKYRLITGLYCITAYSRFRNRHGGVNK